MSSGSQQAGNTTQTNLPPNYMLPYIGTGLNNAAQLYAKGGPQYYSGNTVAGFSDPQQKAMSGIDRLAQKGTPALKAAQNFDTTLLNGGGTNPYEDAMFKQAAGASQSQLASQFAGAGRNIEASAPLRGEQLNNLANQFYGSQYQNNMQNALQAGNQAQNLYNTRLGGYGQEMNVGGMVQNQAQNMINADKNRFDYYQNLPYQNLGMFQNMLGGFQTGQQMQTPYFTNPMAGALGGASAGSSFGPWGAAGGAALGYLGSGG